MLQEIIDNAAAGVVASTLHTVGAIGMLGGLAAFIAWSRHYRHGQHQVAVLQAGAVLTYFSIFGNLVGGFMRTYQTGHPGITEIGSSLWVQLMTVKHILLFVGMGALVYLFEFVAPRALRKKAPERLARPIVSAWIVVIAISIAVAAILGAVSQTIPLGEPMEMDQESAAQSYHFEGSLTTNPLSPAPSRGGFVVAAGADSLNGVLQWSPAAFSLRVELTDPNGTVYTSMGASGRATVDVEAPVAGAWTYLVEAPQAVAVGWVLDILASDGGHEMQRTVTVPAGEFYEINTEMKENAEIGWDWNSTGVLHFNLHTHFDGQVQDHVDEDGKSHADSFTAYRDGGYSLMWVNEGSSPVTVTYKVYGDFHLHSIT